jgi:hypothetical protein
MKNSKNLEDKWQPAADKEGRLSNDNATTIIDYRLQVNKIYETEENTNTNLFQAPDRLIVISENKVRTPIISPHDYMINDQQVSKHINF